MSDTSPIVISGVLPQTAVKADHFPARSETGIGALMPWADRLWFVTYVAHKQGTGEGTGLFWIDDAMKRHKHPASVVGTYANRMIHRETNQLMIGPHLIDTEGNVRTVEALIDIRITATARHLTDPENKVHCLGMEGEFFEVDMHSGEASLICDLRKETGLVAPGEALYEQPHFKGMYTNQGRVVVANNSYNDDDYCGRASHGRLAEWDGDTWSVIDQSQWNEVMGRYGRWAQDAILATGQDRASAILKMRLNGEWTTYRLPKGTHTQDHSVTTEWPRIREIESERFLMNICGMFYELPAIVYAGALWGIRPVCTHLRIIGDYCSWNGLLVMAGDQTTPIWDQNAYVGQPQANLWFGKSDDLWNWGKPKGWGGPWADTPVTAGQPSDPFLMTGFEHKCLHLTHDAGKPVSFTVELDFQGDGGWHAWKSIEVGSDGYHCEVFPTGLSAHWIRVVSNTDCTASAQLAYT